MVLAHSTYSVLLSLAALVAGLIALSIYQRRRATPSATPLLVFMLGLCWWDLTYAVYWADFFSPSPTFWLDTTFLGVVVAPTAFFVFALQYTRRDQPLPRHQLLLLCVMPILTLVALWTDPWHGLFFTQPRDPTQGTILSGGPFFWASFIYLYSINLIAVILLIRAFRGAAPLYRSQARIVLWGGLIPWFTNFLSVVGLNPLPEIDLTPLAFTLTGGALAYGLFFHRLLDIVPVARDLLIEHMHDGVMVLDGKARVIDINLAARHIVGITTGDPVGRPATDFLQNYPDLAAAALTGNMPASFQLTRPDSPRVLDVRVVVLPSHTEQPTGYLVVIRDVTEQVQADTRLREANQNLQVQLAEIERLQQELQAEVIRDSLTGLFNRRFFEETLQRELARAEREHQPLALILVDIDYFKTINDKFGHSAGDLMLQSVAQLLQLQIRDSDIACRIGGEEFAIVLPGATGDQAAQRAEQWREQVNDVRVPFADDKLHATISAGVAEYPVHGTTRDQLLHTADTAMYLSKHRGRNRVTLSNTRSDLELEAVSTLHNSDF